MEASPFSPSVRKDAADFTDANPVEAEHVYLLMAKNFPPDAIQWVKRAKWIGPIWVPWDRIDQDDRKEWAASHQPEKVAEFEKAIKAHSGHVAPSIMVQEPNSQKAFIVDGHHRALAHENLKQKVLAYIGNIEPKDRMAAEETHSKQVHQGADPENKTDPYEDARQYVDIEDLLTKLDGFWFSRETGQPPQRKEVFKALTELRDAGYDERLLSWQARGFGWTVEQLDNPFLRTWLCGEG